ncbi:MAG: hypothetical protein K2M69_06000 [Muribaculaceae bacterium]|nr:hypothetical protein [Muribaculaceae bacterium]
MKEIDDVIFEYLFNKIFREGYDWKFFINNRNGRIEIIECNDRNLYFLINGDIDQEKSFTRASKDERHKCIFVRSFKTLKPQAIPIYFIFKFVESFSVNEFEDELIKIYHEEFHHEAEELTIYKRRELRKIFSKYLEEAGYLNHELSKRYKETIFDYASRLAGDKASYEKSEAVKLIFKCDEQISSLWLKLRYNYDKRIDESINNTIDSLIKQCLDDINSLSIRLGNRSD